MNDFLWITGPCMLENESMYLDTADKLVEIMKGRLWYYKASFDKANRSAIEGRRGLGLDACIDIFKKVKSTHPDIKLTTDVHETHQVQQLVGIIDAIQVPAFLCRQTDLLTECGKYFDIVHVKKGQWIDPENIKHFAGKIRAHKPDTEVWVGERGTALGYNKLIVDFGAVDDVKGYCDRYIMDCTHATQHKKGDFTGGDRELAIKYMLSAVIFGYNGVFAEIHPNPAVAQSDADCQIDLKDWPRLLNKFDAIMKALT